MTTRRNLFIIAGGAALTAACREPARATVSVPDLVVAEGRRGLVVLGGARPRDLGDQAVLSPDGALACAVSRDDAGAPLLLRLDPAKGEPDGRTPIAAGWVPRVISADGANSALTRMPAPDRPAARPRTALLVVAGGRQREYDLGGVVEPDAFTTDGTGLFVLEWLPREAPERYRVRLLDLGSGVLNPLYTRDKVPVPPGAEEEMRGDGRQAVLSPGRDVLYTLYTHQPGHRHTRDLIAGRPGGAHAFVHVLHLAQGWAYCLDLPHPFGEGPAAGHALAVSADGRRLAVADVTSGSLAYADTETLKIERVVAAAKGGDAASLAFTPDGGRVLLGAGPAVTAYDPGTGAVAARWSVPTAVRGLGLNRDGSRVYAGGADEIVWLDAATGALRGRAPVEGLTALRHVR
ncbi:YncE family protein [Amorphoplanes digitatis]|uniref:Lipoprotein n=1 Tax=Actinoplanes digitatis TaxID=1868 RepID=A0A7W7HXJ2_9ACTN|nr:hypothetical protein [Actinoplanes digitatis]MBB4762586.1 hypothetical protein [Actinoplanes digitatis]GID91913.1 hypothetical protein Adi01nite_13250 [Actinoplanes digitatis]